MCGLSWKNLLFEHHSVAITQQDPLPILGVFTIRASLDNGKSEDLDFIVVTVPHLNLLGRLAVSQMDIKALRALFSGQAMHAIQHDESR